MVQVIPTFVMSCFNLLKSCMYQSPNGWEGNSSQMCSSSNSCLCHELLSFTKKIVSSNARGDELVLIGIAT